jgi:eukaryotic-like serine/threonine-protein kinase
MAKKILPGRKVGHYTIIELLNEGNYALAYAAKAADGSKVFFKQYKSPSVMVSWYPGFVAYQKEIKRRVESTRVKNFCYRMLDFFEETYGARCFFEVFEFVDKGADLKTILEKMQKRPDSVPWEKRLILAKVMTAGIAALHEAGIVHCDLKPANIQLFEDTSIEAGYRLKLIDMDFSILAGKRAPWHGTEGYVGSPGYKSPEHLRAGEAPTPASDVFTCGLMLYELLADGNPYRDEDEETYAKKALARKAEPPRLAGTAPTPAHNDQIVDYLYRCLSPDPRKRPTARDLNLVLIGRLGEDVSPKPVPPPASPVAVPEAAPDALVLVGETDKLVCRVRTVVGKALVAKLGSGAQFWDARQFEVERQGAAWVVLPNLGLTNQTLLNGRKVKGATVLKDGDVLAVGSEERKIVKLALKVCLPRVS